MKKLALYSIFLCISLNLQAQISNNNEESAWEKDISQVAIQELQSSGAPSLQIAIGYKDSIIFEKAYGNAALENNILATTETKYRTASISKLFTATVSLMLVQQGKLNLDSPIQEYCSSFPDKSKEITTRQLLTHTAGIRSYIDINEELQNAGNAKDSSNIIERHRIELIGTYSRYTDIKDALDNFKEDPLLFEPGTDWSYSSQGYRIVGCVLEGVSGMTYQQLTKELIFKPLGMENTVEDDAWAIIQHRASGYRIEREKPIRRADMRDVSENLPAGGHLSTASDLILFGQGYLNGKFLPSETTELMTSSFFKDVNNVEEKPKWRYAIPSKENYGYGVMIFPSEDTKRFGSTGRQAGGSSILVMIPEKQLTIAVLTNAKGWNGYISFTEAVEEIITKKYLDSK